MFPIPDGEAFKTKARAWAAEQGLWGKDGTLKWTAETMRRFLLDVRTQRQAEWPSDAVEVFDEYEALLVKNYEKIKKLQGEVTQQALSLRRLESAEEQSRKVTAEREHLVAELKAARDAADVTEVRKVIEAEYSDLVRSLREQVANLRRLLAELEI